MNFQIQGNFLPLTYTSNQCNRGSESVKERKICYLPTHLVHSPQARKPTIAPLRFGRWNIPDTNLHVAKLQHSVRISVLGILP